MSLDSSYTFKPASSKAWLLLAQFTAIFLCVYVGFTWIAGQRRTQAFVRLSLSILYWVQSEGNQNQPLFLQQNTTAKQMICAHSSTR